MTTRTKTAYILPLVLLAAVLLRWPGLFWGHHLAGGEKTFVPLHPDEPRFVEIARGLHGENPYRKSYVLGLGNLLRLYLSASEWAGRRPDDAELNYAARAVSLAAGLGIVILVFALALKLFRSRESAWLAAGLVALNTACVTQSHYGTADMAYTFLLYLFLWLAWRMDEKKSRLQGFLAAFVAGCAMAVKFGPVLIPSLLMLPFLLPRKRELPLLLFPFTVILTFLGLQSFHFGRENLDLVWQMYLQDNVQTATAAHLSNPLVYGFQLLRILGLPVVTLVILFVPRAPSAFRQVRFTKGLIIGFLPILLHFISILSVGLPFPRHLLPVLPAFILLAAGEWSALPSGKRTSAILVLGWSLLITLSDQYAFRNDSRAQADLWLAGQKTEGKTMWADPYIKISLSDRCRAGLPGADYVLRHEGWYYRFERSELSPFRKPDPSRLYHATSSDWAVHKRLEDEIASGQRYVAFEAKPLLIMPEQWLYDKAWGSLEKFAGACVILARRNEQANKWLLE